MPAVDPRIIHGNLPAGDDMIDEPNMLVQSLSVKPTREKKAYKGANRCTAAVEFVDPLLTFSFDAIVSQRLGLAAEHPGTEVTELLNFVGVRFGFDPNDGTLVYEDPSSEQNLDSPEMVKFSVVHYPFV